MNIEKIIKNDELTFKLSGRLDSTTAPDLETELDSSVTGIKALVFDMSDLEYLASAGLRLILKAQKIMNSQGYMKLIGVNETVQEVFDMTGFSDILTIE